MISISFIWVFNPGAVSKVQTRYHAGEAICINLELPNHVKRIRETILSAEWDMDQAFPKVFPPQSLSQAPLPPPHPV